MRISGTETRTIDYFHYHLFNFYTHFFIAKTEYRFKRKGNVPVV